MDKEELIMGARNTPKSQENERFLKKIINHSRFFFLVLILSKRSLWKLLRTSF